MLIDNVYKIKVTEEWIYSLSLRWIISRKCIDQMHRLLIASAHGGAESFESHLTDSNKLPELPLQTVESLDKFESELSTQLLLKRIVKIYFVRISLPHAQMSYNLLWQVTQRMHPQRLAKISTVPLNTVKQDLGSDGLRQIAYPFVLPLLSSHLTQKSGRIRETRNCALVRSYQRIYNTQIITMFVLFSIAIVSRRRLSFDETAHKKCPHYWYSKR